MPGAEYNQTINGNHYFIQEEFSNSAYNANPTYACAQNNEQSVVFDPNGGTGSMGPQFGVSSSPLSPNTFTLANRVFMGWNTAFDGSGIAYANRAAYNFAASATMYAQWGYQVSFNPNGGTGSMPPQVNVVATALSTNSLTRPGYTFTGWNTAANGSGTAYLDRVTYPFTTTVTLYAQWALQSPLAPQNVSAKTGIGSVTLSWTAPSAGGPPSGYQVFEGSAHGAESATPLNGTTAITGLSYVVTGVVAGQSRYFYVTSLNTTGVSPHSSEVKATTPRSSTTTTLSVTPANVSHLRHQSVVFHVKVVAKDVAASSGGTVRVRAGSKLLCIVTLSRADVGTCHVNSSSLSVGRHLVSAVFAGTSSALGSTSASRALVIK